MLSEIISHMNLSIPDLVWPERDPKTLQAIVLVTVFSVLFFFEARWVYRKTPARIARQSYLTNLGTFILNDTLLSLLSVTSLLVLAEHYGGWGLLHLIDEPFWQTVLAFLLLDLTLYLWHWACHRADWLWIFHRIHHSDPCMNVSTAFRLHIVEVFLTTLIKALFIVITGVTTGSLIMSELIITVFVMFHHANLRIPGERWLAWVTIVPYLHRVHHSALRQEHDRNYGAVFSFWDRLFGTFAALEPNQIGLRQVGPQGIIDLLLFGFRPLEPAVAPALPVNRQPASCASVNMDSLSYHRMIKEAAYYRAEKRGFAPGFDFHDWIEAEKEIRGYRRDS